MENEIVFVSLQHINKLKMNDIKKDFRNFALSNTNVNRGVLDKYEKRVSNLPKDYQSTYILEERQLNVTQLDIYSRLFLDRILFFNSDVNSETMSILQAQLLYLDSAEPGKDISLYINSGGGEVYAGLALIDTMNFITSDISTLCSGMAASMAAVILACGTKDKRFILPHSRVMIHQPLGGASGQASDIEISCKEILKVKKELYEILSEKTGQTFEKVETDCNRDYWLSSQDSIEYGLVDKIIVKK